MGSADTANAPSGKFACGAGALALWTKFLFNISQVEVMVPLIECRDRAIRARGMDRGDLAGPSTGVIGQHMFPKRRLGRRRPAPWTKANIANDDGLGQSRAELLQNLEPLEG
jgi:hypothetical protein